MNKLKAILPLLLAIYIMVETILKINNIELCSSTGCALAGELLKFDSLYLNYLGVVGAIVLLILALLKLDKFYTILSVTMVAFESLLIASQLNINPEVCKFCLGVYTFLLAILFVANRRVFAYTIPVIGAIFVAFSILSIPKNKNLIVNDGLYLIASKTCPHCKKTKEFLDKEQIKYKIIPSKDINAYYFAKSLNINKIPIAIKKSGDEYKVLVGDEKIINFFKKDKSKTQETTQETPQITQEPFKPKLNYGEEGCTFNPIEEPTCESENGNSK